MQIAEQLLLVAGLAIVAFSYLSYWRRTGDARGVLAFWRKGMAGFEEPLPIETVDIMPTLAASIGLPLAAPLPDGKCRDVGLSGGVCGAK